MADIKQLRQAEHDLRAKGRAINDLIRKEGRDPTADEDAQLDALVAQIEQAASAVKAEESRMERARMFDTVSVPQGDTSTMRITGGDPVTDKAGNPWESFGHQMAAIYEAGRPGGRVDPRLLVPDRNAAATGGGANVGSDGGFLVRTQYSAEIYRRAYENSALASRCSRIGIGPDADSLEVPYIEETSRATGSRWGGVQVYRRNEADTVTAKRPKIGTMETKLEDLMGLAYATDRLLRDASAMSQVYTDAFSEEFAFKLQDEILRGTGSGECLGVLNAPALVTVAKETGQTAATITSDNILKMWSHAWGRGRGNAAWFINQDCEPQLYTMGVTVGTGGTVAFMPPGGLSQSPYATLMGRPVIPIEQCSTVGTVGDIVLADMAQYQLIDKDGLQSDSSMHVRFIYAEMTFRWIMRVNGQPKWKSALTPYKGSNTQSPFVALATRA